MLKIIAGFLGIIVFAVAVVFATFTGRFYMMETYHSVKFYFKLVDSYVAEPLCQSGGANIGSCLEKIITDMGGYHYLGQFSFTGLFLQKNIPQSDEKSGWAGNIAIIRMLDPDKFWIGSIKSKTARKLFKVDKKKLLDTFTEQRARIAAGLENEKDPGVYESKKEFIKVLDEKIAKLSE